ncbi:MAG: hypothetical protein A4E32_01981 [Methanomassiliicoccales archaeon PtaU1.Bin124]|nr:MAG: hypothetical protein A4E32_01981 [Methanomassiliicoccales archaeon PtaU1.Bin124]
MKKKGLLAIAVVIVAAVVLVGTAFALMGNQKVPTYNAAQVYITSWTLGPNDTSLVDVQFRISLDLDGDGVCEINKTSATFNSTTFEMAPFKLGGPVNTDVKVFHFKIEVIRIGDGAVVNMRYTNDGSSPLYNATNDMDASGSWSLASPHEDAGIDCSIEFAYYVN